MHTEQLGGRPVTVIDTPGFFDTRLAEEEVKREAVRCLVLAAPGPHAFLLVVKVGPYEEEEREAVRKILALFGEEALRYALVLFTRGDYLRKKSVEQFFQRDEHLRELVGRCGGRYHVFNNRAEGERAQAAALLGKLERLARDNGGHYTNPVYQAVDEALRREQAGGAGTPPGAAPPDPAEGRRKAKRRLFGRISKISIAASAGAILGALVGTVAGAVLSPVCPPAAVLGPLGGAALGGLLGGSAGAEAESPLEAVLTVLKLAFKDLNIVDVVTKVK
ncbi:GTPase IMAP family member 4-like isoform X2 [Lepisosteus oculatus]